MQRFSSGETVLPIRRFWPKGFRIWVVHAQLVGCPGFRLKQRTDIVNAIRVAAPIPQLGFAHCTVHLRRCASVVILKVAQIETDNQAGEWTIFGLSGQSVPGS
jgi:hypothetical protein